MEEDRSSEVRQSDHWKTPKIIPQPGARAKGAGHTGDSRVHGQSGDRWWRKQLLSWRPRPQAAEAFQTDRLIEPEDLAPFVVAPASCAWHESGKRAATKNPPGPTLAKPLDGVEEYAPSTMTLAR